MAGFLTGIGEAIMQLGDDLLRTAGEETGLPRPRLEGERARTVGQLALFARVVTEGSWVQPRIDRALPQRVPAPRPDLRSMLVPLGPVAVFGASNFPFAYSTMGGDSASALAAGCPVVMKAHPAHPRTSDLVAGAVHRAVQKAGLPAGTFGHVHGGPAEGIELVTHPLIRAVGFTGSQRAGRALFDAAARRPEPIPVYAEMGSVNPVVLLKGAMAADPSGLAAALAQSVALGVGQFCTNPGLLFVEDGPGARGLLDALAAKIAVTEPGTMLTPGIAAAFAAGVDRFAAVPGVAVAGRGSRDPDPTHREGRAALLTVSAADFLAHPELREEVFGPSTLVILCRDLAELCRALEAVPGQLTGTLEATDAELSAHPELVSALQDRVGRLVFRGVPTGVEVSDAMVHGGPYPATTDSRTTSVGSAAILRWARPVSYQNCPDALLPPALKNANPLGLLRLIDGSWSKDPLV